MKKFLVLPADTRSSRGMVYPRAALEESFKKYSFAGKKLPLIISGTNLSSKEIHDPPLGYSVGFIENLHLIEEGVVGNLIENGFTSDDMRHIFNDPAMEKCFTIRLGGVGKVDENGVVSDYNATMAIISPISEDSWCGQPAHQQ